MMTGGNMKANGKSGMGVGIDMGVGNRINEDIDMTMDNWMTVGNVESISIKMVVSIEMGVSNVKADDGSG